MRTSLTTLLTLSSAVLLFTGCAGPEKKLGRGMANTMEIVRLGEMRRSVEQTAIFYSPEEGYTRGFVSGLNKSLARTCVGVFEIVTFPIPTPSYDPVFTNYLTPNPVYPANYRPNLRADSLFATDTTLGYSGGDIAPLIPGSRFHIFQP